MVAHWINAPACSRPCLPACLPACLLSVRLRQSVSHSPPLPASFPCVHPIAAYKWEGGRPKAALEPFILLLSPYAPHLGEFCNFAAKQDPGCEPFVSCAPLLF